MPVCRKRPFAIHADRRCPRLDSRRLPVAGRAARRAAGRGRRRRPRRRRVRRPRRPPGTRPLPAGRGHPGPVRSFGFPASPPRPLGKCPAWPPARLRDWTEGAARVVASQLGVAVQRSLPAGTPFDRERPPRAATAACVQTRPAGTGLGQRADEARTAARPPPPRDAGAPASAARGPAVLPVALHDRIIPSAGPHIAAYLNRRRIQSARGRRLLRQRGDNSVAQSTNSVQTPHGVRAA